MSLREDTTVALVDGWSDGRQPAWAVADRHAIRTKLIAISDAATPHLVGDAPLDDDSTQHFLLLRTQSAIEAWLIRAAAGIRRSLPLGSQVRTAAGAPVLGLRSADLDEFDGIGGIGRERAADIARAVTLHAGIDELDDLNAVDGVGPAILSRLKAKTYLDRPLTALASPSLLAFSLAPTIANFLILLERTDLELFHGDGNRLVRRPPAGGTAVSRFINLLNLVHADAARRRSPLSGVLASRAARALARGVLHRRYLDALTAVDGALVVNESYHAAMLEMIAAANNNLRLAVFVATATRQGTSGAGSFDIIEALEARAETGLAVRVILDRDRPDDPYRSTQINRRTIERLRAKGVNVKQDEREVLLHSKFMVADHTSVIVGSHNLTTSSIAHTHEVSVRLDNPALATVFADRFDTLWATLP